MELPRWSRDDLAAAIGSGRAILVETRSPMCARCGPQEQVILRLVPEYGDRVEFGSIDIVEHPEVVEAYELASVPTQLLFSGGALQTVLPGFRRAPELRDALDRLASPSTLGRTTDGEA